MTTIVRKSQSLLDRLFRGARFAMPDGFAGGGGAPAGGAQAPAAPAAPAMPAAPGGQVSGDGEVYQGLGAAGAPQDPGQGQAPGGAGAWPEQLKPYGIESEEQLRSITSRASMYEAQQELIQQLMQVNEQRGQGGGMAPGAQAPAERQFIGPGGVFPNQAAANAAFQADPNYYYRKQAEWQAGLSGGRGGADPALAGEVRQIKQSMMQQSWNASLRGLMDTHPHLKDPTVQRNVDQFIGANAGWARQVQEHVPGVDIAGILVKAGDYDRLVGELAALKGRMGEVRGSAGVARTSVGGPQAPLAPAKTHAEVIQRWAAKWRSEHGTEPPGLDAYMAVAGRVA